MSTISEACNMLGPASGLAEPRKPKLLTGAGTTEDVTDTALEPGSYATLMVGSVGIRFVLNTNATATSQVASTDIELPPYGRHDWKVDPSTIHVHTESTDGLSTHKAWVFQSSPGKVGR